MKYNIYDNSTLEAKAIGTIDLDDSVGALELVALARGGNLNLVIKMSKEEAAAIEAGVKASEQSIVEAERDAAKKHERDSKVPAKFEAYIELTAKQLKTMCDQRGLPTSGNKFDSIARLEEHDAKTEVEAEAKKLKK